MGAVLSMLHLKVKFPTKKGIVAARGGQSVARQAAVNNEIKQKEQISDPCMSSLGVHTRFL